MTDALIQRSYFRSSPLYMKVETMLRMVRFDYACFSQNISEPVAVPKEDDAGTCENIADVLLEENIDNALQIMDDLANACREELDEHLAELDKVRVRSIERLMEEPLLWSILYARWFDSVNYQDFKDNFPGTCQEGDKSLGPDEIKLSVEKMFQKNGFDDMPASAFYIQGEKVLSLQNNPNLVRYCERMRAKHYKNT